MMVWNIEFTKEAQKDIRKLREPSKSHVNEAINKVAQNPLPLTEGGYGKPLGHKRDGNLNRIPEGQTPRGGAEGRLPAGKNSPFHDGRRRFRS